MLTLLFALIYTLGAYSIYHVARQDEGTTQSLFLAAIWPALMIVGFILVSTGLVKPEDIVK